jgi:hypothetical protein
LTNKKNKLAKKQQQQQQKITTQATIEKEMRDIIIFYLVFEFV